MTARILSQLTAERLRDVLNYDHTTGEFFWKSSGRGRKLGRVAGYQLGGLDGKYIYISVDGNRYYAHRLAWLYVYGEWPSGHIDHKEGDCDGINNLRVSDKSKNACNAKKRSDNTSGFKGVRNIRRLGLKKSWRARIWIDGTERFLGYFGTATEAAVAYDEAALRLHGEFARTNKMLGLLP